MDCFEEQWTQHPMKSDLLLPPRSLPRRPTIVNVLLSTFPGLGLPATLNLHLPATFTISAFHEVVGKLLQDRTSGAVKYALSTNGNEWIRPTSIDPLSSLLECKSQSSHVSNLLPLRLTVPTLGGKGGFGSQLRAAGGRMASRKKNRNNQPVPNSNRNLDGRRLRTVGEAKALAEYLAVKPEMERKDKEERRKRWEDVVAAAERRETEIKEGKYRQGNARGDGAWVEEKEEVEGKVRESIKEAMARGLLDSEGNAIGKGKASSEESNDASEVSNSESDEARPGPSKPATPKDKGKARKVFGWDDDDGDDSDSQPEEAKK